MPTIQDLQPLLSEPREDLGAEYKDWLDLTTNDGRATVAKAAIAIVNHGGGFIILGVAEEADGLRPHARPAKIPEITQDAINNAIRRFAAPEFHCQVYQVPDPETGVVHPIVVVPATLTEPVMSRRDCGNIISQNRCYIRKPGPRSEEPQTGAEWRALLNRCLRAGRDDMLEAIRAIVSGRVDTPNARPDAEASLAEFVDAGRARWSVLVADLPDDSPSRFPHGHYEMAFSLVGVTQAPSLNALRERLAEARRIALTGWTPFLEMLTQGWEPYAYEQFVEAWVGRPVRDDWMARDPSLCDFWRASREGKLFTMRGYSEDGLDNRPAGQLFDVTLPIWRIGEAMLFASRFAGAFEDVDEIIVWCRFTGLAGRRLTSITNRWPMFEDNESATDEITLSVRVRPDQVQDNLAEILHPLLTPLYERFNFFQLPFDLVEAESTRLRGRA